jgi:hypothetical protein
MLILQLKKLGKEKSNKHKEYIRTEIVRVETEINEIEGKYKPNKRNKSTGCFLDKLGNINQEKKRNMQIINIRNKRCQNYKCHIE